MNVKEQVIAMHRYCIILNNTYSHDDLKDTGEINVNSITSKTWTNWIISVRICSKIVSWLPGGSLSAVKEGKRSKIENYWASGQFLRVGLTFNIVLYLWSQVIAPGLFLFILYFIFIFYILVHVEGCWLIPRFFSINPGNKQRRKNIWEMAQICRFPV